MGQHGIGRAVSKQSIYDATGVSRDYIGKSCTYSGGRGPGKGQLNWMQLLPMVTSAPGALS